MTTHRAQTVSFPLGLLCAATFSVPPQKPLKPATPPVREDDELETGALDLRTNGLDEKAYWRDVSG